jgi:hypothetical protein
MAPTNRWLFRLQQQARWLTNLWLPPGIGIVIPLRLLGLVDDLPGDSALFQSPFDRASAAVTYRLI